MTITMMASAVLVDVLSPCLLNGRAAADLSGRRIQGKSRVALR
ncbi:hypothetical protein [Azoarcus olearius]|uniref:Hypothetical secreted protein n=1 Tax=Azoarcus sp. (strain BH72) TaxID=418699 RepID=A1K2Q1_AZOSB|nr:hypothetical protein [Azoarcus olearius]CAL93106.1 hypothetical secreted protein [Azoarcus olearius]